MRIVATDDGRARNGTMTVEELFAVSSLIQKIDCSVKRDTNIILPSPIEVERLETCGKLVDAADEYKIASDGKLLNSPVCLWHDLPPMRWVRSGSIDNHYAEIRSVRICIG